MLQKKYNERLNEFKNSLTRAVSPVARYPQKKKVRFTEKTYEIIDEEDSNFKIDI